MVAGLVALALGCPAPKGEPTASPADAPAGDRPAAAATATGGPAAPTGPVVLYAVSDGVLAPILCHDGTQLLPGDTTDCMALAPAGELVVLDTGARATLGDPTEAACNGSELARFEGRGVEGELGDGRVAIWPMTASTAVKLQEAALAPTAEELAAMVALLEKETEGLFEVRPKLEATSGLLADLDGDGAPDRVFAAHEDGRLYGVVAAFLAHEPSSAVPLSVLQFDVPHLFGTSDLDGRPGQEVLVDAAFVEGIEDQNVVSAFSRRVVALHDGAAAAVGSWGCRMF